MKFLNFLLQVHQNKALPTAQLVGFCGQRHYPLLFFSLLFSWLKKQKYYQIVSVDVDEQKEPLIQARLATSFLGTPILYWFGNLAKLNYKRQERWISYLQEYRGPHTIAFFITEDISFSFAQGAVTVHIPDAVSHKEMIVLQQLLPTISSTLNKQFLQQLGKKQQNISLDLSCLLIHYALLIGKNSDIFFATWLDHIMPLQTSLFLLSQYFFAKNTRLFFTEWLRIHNDYNPQFWIAFWSEQLWRATLWVDLTSNKSYTEAKKIQFKLPFSFIKRDWKKYHADELQQAHQFLTAADYHLKNNGSPHSLDLFYSKFFLNQFA